MSINLQMIKVISFDLDDTLYDNRPIIKAAEEASHDYLQQVFATQNKSYNRANFSELRNELLKADPARYENLTSLRRQVLKVICSDLENSELIAENALRIFLVKRNEVQIPNEIVKLIEILSTQYKLVTATNGNCSGKELAIGNYFEKHYSTEQGFKAKPHPQMLKKAIIDLQISPKSLLHIGDSKAKDGKAAVSANCQFYRFSPFENESRNFNNEIKKLKQVFYI